MSSSESTLTRASTRTPHPDNTSLFIPSLERLRDAGLQDAHSHLLQICRHWGYALSSGCSHVFGFLVLINRGPKTWHKWDSGYIMTGCLYLVCRLAPCFVPDRVVSGSVFCDRPNTSVISVPFAKNCSPPYARIQVRVGLHEIGIVSRRTLHERGCCSLNHGPGLLQPS